MQTRLLKNTTLTISRICIGTMTFGNQCDEPLARHIIDFALDSGVNFIDTANVYNGGVAEEITGNILQGRRSQVILASKVGLKVGNDEDESGLSRRAICRAIDKSLARLRTDYLDIYYLHQPDYLTPYEETLEVMDSLIRAGKIRYAAVSNFASWQICLIQSIAEKTGYQPIYISQPVYNLLARGLEQEYFPMAKQTGINTIVYNPLAGGLLSGKHNGESPLPGTRFDLMPIYRNRYWNASNLRAIEKLRRAACAEGGSLVGVSLNWILNHSPTDCVVLGASQVEQLQENISVLDDAPLPPETLQACDEVWHELDSVAPKYNR